MPGLLDLPIEILLDIHTLALNPLFPQTHPTIYQSCHLASSHYVAKYHLSLYSQFGPNAILVRALRHPVCDVDVARSIMSLWKQKLECPPLTCSELPRRLFRSLTETSPIPPLLIYLLESYSPSINSHNGYPLCRAVLVENTTLIKFLIDHGAGKSLKDTLALEIAISRKKLALVKMLVESTAPPTPKKRKVEDRIRITPRLLEYAMSRDAKDIVNYFVQEKGVMPHLKTIMKLGQTKRIKL